MTTTTATATPMIITKVCPIPSYLGTLGYTLDKTKITEEQLKKVRNDLTVVPQMMTEEKARKMGVRSTGAAFDIYRETPNKLFIPHIYGVREFGAPQQVKIKDGDPIQVQFRGTLREDQVAATKAFLEHALHVPIAVGGGKGLFILHTGWGKTTATMFLIAALRQKTLVVVNTNPLKQQWIERIEQYLPGAHVGWIQGDECVIEDRDIVICMVQTLSQRVFPANQFVSFGFAVFDEVHHLTANVFSNVLGKIVTRFMLGLSACIERKNQTEHVLDYYLGKVLHQREKKPDESMVIRAIRYVPDHPDPRENQKFLQSEVNDRGNILYSTMIRKLCEFTPRTDFILRVLCDHISTARNLEEAEAQQAYNRSLKSGQPVCKVCMHPDKFLVQTRCCGAVCKCIDCWDEEVRQQKERFMEEESKRQYKEGANFKAKSFRPRCTECGKTKLAYEQYYLENPYIKPIEHTHTIVMTHNLSVLQYMYRRFCNENLGSAGMFVGKMKFEDLERSKKCHVMLATYNMTSEGLDVPSLTTEFTITPKTDMLQISGRIPRVKHATTAPEIYDIIDENPVFQKQWYRGRKPFYRKFKFQIQEISSDRYDEHRFQWRRPNAITNAELDEKEEKQEEQEEASEEVWLGVAATAQEEPVLKKARV